MDRLNTLGPDILEVLKAAAVWAISATFSVSVSLVGDHATFETPHERPAFLKRQAHFLRTQVVNWSCYRANVVGFRGTVVTQQFQLDRPSHGESPVAASLPNLPPRHPHFRDTPIY
jgi:hypothetical protein